MLNTANGTEKEGVPTALNDRRLASISKGHFDWLGDGFLAVIKDDCEKSKHPDSQYTDRTSQKV